MIQLSCDRVQLCLVCSNKLNILRRLHFCFILPLGMQVVALNLRYIVFPIFYIKKHSGALTPRDVSNYSYVHLLRYGECLYVMLGGGPDNRDFIPPSYGSQERGGLLWRCSGHFESQIDLI